MQSRGVAPVAPWSTRRLGSTVFSPIGVSPNAASTKFFKKLEFARHIKA